MLYAHPLKFLTPRRNTRILVYCTRMFEAQKAVLQLLAIDRVARLFTSICACRGRVRPLMPVEIKPGDTVAFGELYLISACSISVIGLHPIR